MSNISLIYNRVDALLGETFTSGNGYRKMIYPYDLDQNDRFILNKGYGFYISNGNNTDIFFEGNIINAQRELVIILSRVDRGTDFDTDLRESAEKLLFEDQLTLISALNNDEVLKPLTSKIVYDSDNGIEFAFDEQERSNYLFLQTSFLFDYIECL